jgi:hypothetical protein
MAIKVGHASAKLAPAAAHTPVDAKDQPFYL